MTRPRIFQLITPPGMLLTTALLVIYCAYALLIGLIEKSAPLLIGSVIAIVATYATAMVRSWSRYLVYALIVGFVAKLGHSIWYAIQAGYFSFQFGSTREIVESLAPSIGMTLVSLGCGLLVHRQFRAPRIGQPLAAPATQAAE